MARLSLECSTSQQENACSALDRISHVLCGLENSLVELGEVQNILEQESTRACSSSLEDVEATDGVDLLLVAGTLRKMVGALASNIKGDPEVQKVLPVTIQKYFASSDCNTIRKQPTMVEPGTSCGPETACIPDSGPRALKRIAVESQVSYNCVHGSGQHSEVMNPLVWSRLPDHLLGHVLARLPLPEMFLVPCLSKAWLATSKTPSFRGLCAASRCNSKLFGIISKHPLDAEVWLTAFDVNTHKWHYHELDRGVKNLPSKYRSDLLYAHDGGLVCFVSDDSDSIVVCNPLTNLWKTVPLLGHRNRNPNVVQLVRNGETGCYRVILVFSDGREKYTADCYDSKTGLWSTSNFGQVYGQRNPVVFDCQQGILFDRIELYGNPSLEGARVEGYALVEDRVYMLYATRRSDNYNITELAWESSTSAFSRRLKTYECPLPKEPESYELLVYGSSGFILLFADNDGRGAYHHQVLRLFDTSAEKWYDVPQMKVKIRIDFPESYTIDSYPVNTLHEALYDGTFMCDLQWDALP